MVHARILEDRAVVALGGEEARDFLQGLVTNDVSTFGDGTALYAALLTPQGKLLFEFFVIAHDGGFLVDCAAARAADLVKRLTMYRLRSKVEIGLRSDLAVAAFWGDIAQTSTPHAGIAVVRDPRLEALGWRAIGPQEAVAAAVNEATPGEYSAYRISRGVPDSGDLTPDTIFALDAGLEELNGVSFKKGCYVGQEVTSRMKHRASARRRFLIAEIEGDAPVLGTAIEAQGRVVGEWATACGGTGLALVRLDRLAETEAAGAPLMSAGSPVRLRKPEWLALESD